MQLPVAFSFPENYTTTEDLPNTIHFNIHARTGNLMTLKYRMGKNPLEIPLENKAYTSEQISKLLNDRIYAKVESISTPFELAKIILDSLVQKTVPLAVNNELHAKQGYIILNENISPSEIKIKGASKLLAEIDKLYLSKLVLKDLQNSYVDSLHIIKNYSELIELSQEKAKLEIIVDQLVEKEVRFLTSILADTIRVKLSSPSNLYDTIDSTDFNIQILDSIVQVTSKHPHIKVLEYSPGRYELKSN